MSKQCIRYDCKYKEVFNNKHTPMIIIDTNTGSIVDVNLATSNYYSYSKEKLLSMHISEINILSKDEVSKEMNKAKMEAREFFKFKHKLANGEIRDVEVYSGPIKINHKDFLFSIILDAKRKGKLENHDIINKTYFDSLFDNSPEAIAIVDNEFKVLNVNDQFKNIFQYDLTEIENKDLTKILCEQMLYDTSYNFRRSIRKGKFVSEEVKRKRKDGSLLDVLLLGLPLVIDKEIVGAYCIYSDISETKKRENKIKFLTYNDSLTGLFNKEYFLESLKFRISKNRKDKIIKEKIAILVLKVNQFKEINDAMGHWAGYEILKEFGLRIRNSLKNDDVSARFNEDEFAILLSKAEDLEDIKIISDRIIKSLKNTFLIGGNEFQITTSIGIAVYPDDAKEYSTLVRKAEIAMNKYRQFSTSTATKFEDSLDKEIQEYFHIKNDLTKSILDEDFFLHYQPIYDISINKLIGLEALIRWNHQEKGIISPLEFIPIAEKTGMIHAIGEWVLLKACKQNKKWQELGYRHIYMSVNVSALQLEKPDFSKKVKKILKESQMDPRDLQLEITETFFTQDYELVGATLKELSDLGIKIAIDDFGTGYSSLGQLCELDIHNLKIDRIFIDRADANANKSKIVKAIISLAKSLNINLTAEGVERQEELSFLKENGCTVIQGYLFSRPVEAHKIDELLKNSK